MRSLYHETTTVDFCDFVFKIFKHLTHIVIPKICKNVVIPRWQGGLLNCYLFARGMTTCELLYANLHTSINLTLDIRRETSLILLTALSRFTLDVISGPVTRRIHALTGNPVPVFQLVICVCDVISVENIRTRDERNLHSELQQSLIKRHACVEI